jgi:sarcosine oxidase subunit gamma
MPDFSPIARSPIMPAAPVTQLGDWQVSGRQSTSAMRLLDLTPCAKLLLRGSPPLALRNLLPAFGHACRLQDGPWVVAAIPDQWLFIGAPGAAAQLRRWANPSEEPATILLDYSDALVLLRLAGEHSARMLAKACPINLSSTAFPDGRAIRSSVAKIPCTIVRDDLTISAQIATSIAPSVTLSYYLLVERQAGQYLFDCLMDAGSEYHLDADGFSFD